MGLGAAGIMPTTLSILTNIFPSHERPKAIAIWAGVSGLGIAVGPITGGWLLEHFDWNSVFLVNIPVVALAPARRARCSCPSRVIPASRGSTCVGAGALDRRPVGASSGASIEAPGRGWGRPVILAAFAAGAAIIAAFVAWERRTRAPDARRERVPQPALQRRERLDHVRVLRADGRRVLPDDLRAAVLGYGTLDTGVQMLPIAVGMIVASRLVGRSRRAGSARSSPSPAASALVAVALAQFARFEVDTGVRHRSPPRWRRWAWASAWPCRPRPRRSWARCRGPRPASARR